MANQSHSIEQIKTWLVTHAGYQTPEAKLLLGDGSTRCFYRVHEKGSDDTRILISDPVWTQSQDYPAHQQALNGVGIPVPKFFAVDKDSGFILMQDLGDVLLQSEISRAPQNTLNWLTRATELLAHLHGKLYPVPTQLPVCSRSFDETKFFEELLFTQEHLRKKFLGLPDLKQNQIDSIRHFCRHIGQLAPQVFCHRDYHCRNLLVQDGALWMIDFQDARLGPPGYDLASLLFDAYVPISDEDRSRLLDTYKMTLQSYTLFQEINWKNFQIHLYQLAYQRTLKAAGSFASFWTRYQKDSHLRYIEPALKMAKALEKKLSLSSELVESFQIDTMLGILDAKSQHP